MKRTLSQINKEIKSLADKQRKEFAKANAKYGKAWNSLYSMMVKEEKKHPEKSYEIQRKYEAKMKKILNAWHAKGTTATVNKYKSKVKKLYDERSKLMYNQ